MDVKTVSEMDLCVIVAYRDRKRLSVRAIHNNIMALLGSHIVGYSTVTGYLHEAKFPLSTEETSDTNDRKPIEDADELLLSCLNVGPFESLQQPSRLTQLPPTAVYPRPTQFFGFAAHHLRWVSHALSDTRKAQRVTLSGQLLRMLEV
jgi:hypothetical protein